MAAAAGLSLEPVLLGSSRRGAHRRSLSCHDRPAQAIGRTFITLRTLFVRLHTRRVDPFSEIGFYDVGIGQHSFRRAFRNLAAKV